MCLPNFLIIGTQKAGTSWLADMLRQHPEVFMPNHEIHYFNKDFNFSKGIEWYKAHFSEVKHETAIGEKTPDYLRTNGIGVEGHLPNVHRNVHNALPDAKLIVTLRNPVHRVISAVNHIIRSGRISPFHSIDDLLLGNKSSLVEGHGVIDYGKYHRHLMSYLKYFDRSHMLILIFEEDVVQNPSKGLIKVCEFLKIDSSFKFSKMKKRINAFQSSKLCLILNYYTPFFKLITPIADRFLPDTKANPSESVIHKLYRMYAEENEKLFNLLGRRIEAWQIDNQ